MGTFLASERQVQTLTVHRYPLRNCFVGPGSKQYPTVAHLLSSYATTELAAGVRRYVQIAHAAGRKLRIDELNSVACRGKAGVSNTFASSLWVLDALFSLARAGVDGVNMHTLPDSAYQLFSFSHRGGTWSASVAPVYYGLDCSPAPPRPDHGSCGCPAAIARPRQRLGDPGPEWPGPRRGRQRGRQARRGDRSARPRRRRRRGQPDQADGVRACNARGGVTMGGRDYGAQTSPGLLAPPHSTR